MPYSPPTERPCTIRARTSRIGARPPTLAWVGSTAMAREPAHIISTEIISEVLRPSRSAIRPNSQPPIGRMKKPTANTAAD